MTLADMMEGLREGAAKQSKFMGITLTCTEVEPILAEYDALHAEIEWLKAEIEARRVAVEKVYLAQGAEIERLKDELAKAS